jgi:multiple sugar transport system ATP-binding protein
LAFAGLAAQKPPKARTSATVSARCTYLGSGIDTEVVVVEPMGAETELLVKIGGQTLTIVTHGRSSVGPGDKLSLAPNGKYAHLFDAASGARL